MFHDKWNKAFWDNTEICVDFFVGDAVDKSNILLIIFKRQDGEGFIISVDGQNVFTGAE